MPDKIPLVSKASHTFQVVIEEVLYQFRTRWNSREQSWRLDIFEADLNPILQGLKLLPTQNLTGQYADSRLPSGELIVTSNSSDRNPKPSFDDIGASINLLYFSREEINELIQS